MKLDQDCPLIGRVDKCHGNSRNKASNRDQMESREMSGTTDTSSNLVWTFPTPKMPAMPQENDDARVRQGILRFVVWNGLKGPHLPLNSNPNVADSELK